MSVDRENSTNKGYIDFDKYDYYAEKLLELKLAKGDKEFIIANMASEKITQLHLQTLIDEIRSIKECLLSMTDKEN